MRIIYYGRAGPLLARLPIDPVYYPQLRIHRFGGLNWRQVKGGNSDQCYDIVAPSFQRISQQFLMDKRSLIFVFCVTATLFFVNIFFGYYDHQKKKEWLAQRQAYEKQQAVEKGQEYDRRRALISELPVAIAYLTGEQSQGYSVALDLGDSVIIQQQEEQTIPPTIFVKGKEYPFVAGEGVIGSALLYGSGNNFEVARLNELGHYDLQMVGLSEDRTAVEVFLSEYSNGSYQSLEGLVTNGLALMQFDGRYLPVGVFRGEQIDFIPLEDQTSLSALIRLPKIESSLPSGAQSHYVIENDYLQLVFNSVGGALVEINLPLADEDNPDRAVKELAIDRKLIEQSEANARFPQKPSVTVGPDGVRQTSEGTIGGYYPLLRRDLYQGEQVVRAVEPRHFGLNIVSDYPEVAQLPYRVIDQGPTHITFEAKQPHRKIVKTFRLVEGQKAAPYVLDLDILVTGDSRGLYLTSGVPEVEMVSGNSMPSLKYRLTRADKAEVNKISLPKDTVTVTSTSPDWICNSNGFFGLILDPLTSIGQGYQARHVAGGVMPTRLAQVDREKGTYNASKLSGYNALLPLNPQGGQMQFRIFAGPFAEQVLKSVDNAFIDPTAGYTPDYISCQTFHGWFSFISQPIAKVLLLIMKLFHGLTNSWALSIVLLTVVLRAALYPLNSWSMKSMSKMQKLAPELTKIQERYKKDPKKLQEATMGIYRKHGVNPMSGCFPMLIQMPFLIGMFDLLRSTFELRGASFVPGWIDDLAAPDVLFTWDYSLPVIGSEFHLLPLCLGGLMFLQQKWMSTAPKDVNEMTDAQRQQKLMGTMMPVMFTFLFYNFASGLNLYWLSSTFLGLIQQLIINRQIAKDKGVSAK